MGKLLVGRPTLAMEFVVSAPLDFIATLVLVYRVPELGDTADAWTIAARAALDPGSLATLETLFGCSGRAVYLAEELVMPFRPLDAANHGATYADFRADLAVQSPEWFRDALMRAVQRVRRDDMLPDDRPETDDRAAWEQFLAPALTRAHADDALALALHPSDMKARILALFDTFEECCHAADFAQTQEMLGRAAERAERLHESSLAEAFAEMTGNRLPPDIEHAAREVERAAFVPCAHLGKYLSFVLYPPDLVVYFDATRPLDRPARAARPTDAAGGDLAALRALADSTRLRIVEILHTSGELYAQEIVARLGISQSAVSRHLGMLEGAGVVRVRPANGMKYYAVHAARLQQLADALRTFAE